MMTDQNFGTEKSDAALDSTGIIVLSCDHHLSTPSLDPLLSSHSFYPSSSPFFL
jgi:hypothetical protein